MKLKKLPGLVWDLLLWRWVMHMLNSLFSTMNINMLWHDYSIISYMTDEESPIEIKDNIR